MGNEFSIAWWLERMVGFDAEYGERERGEEGKGSHIRG